MTINWLQQSRLVFSLVAFLCLMACNPQSTPETIQGNPLFFVSGEMNNEPFRIQAGVDNYYMFSDFGTTSHNVMAFSSRLALSNDSSEGSYFQFTLFDDSESTAQPVEVEELLTAGQLKFYNQTIPLNNYEVNFEAQNFELEPDSYHWTFGDGTASAERNPVHTYEEPGQYEVCLTVENGDTCFSTLCNSIEVGQSCVADFCYEKINYSTISFQNEAQGIEPLTYHWDFGDNFTSTEANPRHAYESQNEYRVCLTVTDASGCSSTFCKNVLTNLSPSFWAVFEAIPNPNLQPVSYLWEFPDGTSAYTPTTSHIFQNSGIKETCLTIDYENGCQDQLCFPLYVNQDNCETAFTYNFLNSTTLQFTPEVPENSTMDYFWNFGDGSYSEEEMPIHTFSEEGAYKVGLTTTNSNNCEQHFCRRIATQNATTCTANFNVHYTVHEKQRCLANYRFSQTAHSNFPQALFASIRLSYRNSAGQVFSSAGAAQPETSSFEITAFETYLENENGMPTQKVEIQFNCTLFGVNRDIEITNARAVIAIAHP